MENSKLTSGWSNKSVETPNWKQQNNATPSSWENDIKLPDGFGEGKKQTILQNATDEKPCTSDEHLINDSPGQTPSYAQTFEKPTSQPLPEPTLQQVPQEPAQQLSSQQPQQVKAKYCSRCGSPISVDGKFCGNCGFRSSPKITTADGTGRKTTAMAVTIAVLATVIVSAVIFGFIYFNGENRNDIPERPESTISAQTPKPEAELSPEPTLETTLEPGAEITPESELEPTPEPTPEPVIEQVQQRLGEGEELYKAIQDRNTVISLYLFWDDGSETVFFRDETHTWYMMSRYGGVDLINPDFRLRGEALEIHITGYTRVFYLFNNHFYMNLFSGAFGVDDFYWSWNDELFEPPLTPGSTPGEQLYYEIQSSDNSIYLGIYWTDDGTETTFIRGDFGNWILYSKYGDVMDTTPEFTLRGTTLEIRFSTTSRVYYLYDDLTGVFDDNTLTWFFEVYYPEP